MSDPPTEPPRKRGRPKGSRNLSSKEIKTASDSRIHKTSNKGVRKDVTLRSLPYETKQSLSRRPSRSDHYQASLLEIPYAFQYSADDQSSYTEFDNSRSIYSLLASLDHYDETYLNLKDQLFTETMRLAKDNMTPYQAQALALHLDGYTQGEIGYMLGSNTAVGNSGIHKALYGNTDYSRLINGKAQRYGGVIRKLQLAAKADPIVQSILNQMGQITGATITLPPLPPPIPLPTIAYQEECKAALQKQATELTELYLAIPPQSPPNELSNPEPPKAPPISKRAPKPDYEHSERGSDIWRERISAAKKGIPQSPEHIKKRSKPRPQETRDRMSAAHKGKRLSQAHKDSLKVAQQKRREKERLVKDQS